MMRFPLAAKGQAVKRATLGCKSGATRGSTPNAGGGVILGLDPPKAGPTGVGDGRVQARG